MLSIYEPKTYGEVMNRLNKLSPNTKSLWGKMKVDQMLHHLNLTMEAPLGKMITNGHPILFMRIFKSVLYNDIPFRKGVPTPQNFKISKSFNFYEELDNIKQNLVEVTEKGLNSSFKPHIFFGPLTNEQWGKHFYKHIDHHLKQFGF